MLVVVKAVAALILIGYSWFKMLTKGIVRIFICPFKGILYID
jgi:hypothetical protein